MCFLKDCSHVAAIAPSTTRWSLESVTLITLLTTKGLVLASGPSLTTIFFSVPPTARMHACGTPGEGEEEGEEEGEGQGEEEGEGDGEGEEEARGWGPGRGCTPAAH